MTEKCQECSSNTWSCLSCGTTISMKNFQTNKDELVAAYCNCCEHVFVCKKCYHITPDLDVWEDQFEPEHCMIDLHSEITPNMEQILASLISTLMGD